MERALKVRNIAGYFAPSVLPFNLIVTRGDAPLCVRRLPLAIIFRAYGAEYTAFTVLRQSRRQNKTSSNFPSTQQERIVPLHLLAVASGFVSLAFAQFNSLT
jgi:hypothetical protein